MATDTELMLALLAGDELTNGLRLNKHGNATINGASNAKAIRLFAADLNVKKDWRDNLQQDGVLCRVWNDEPRFRNIRTIVSYEKASPAKPLIEHPYKDTCMTSWKNAEPIPKRELERLLENAPE